MDDGWLAGWTAWVAVHTCTTSESLWLSGHWLDQALPPIQNQSKAYPPHLTYPLVAANRQARPNLPEQLRRFQCFVVSELSTRHSVRLPAPAVGAGDAGTAAAAAAGGKEAPVVLAKTPALLDGCVLYVQVRCVVCALVFISKRAVLCAVCECVHAHVCAVEHVCITVV